METIVLIVAGVAIGWIARSLIASVVGEEIRQLEQRRDELLKLIAELQDGVTNIDGMLERMQTTSEQPTSSQGGSS